MLRVDKHASTIHNAIDAIERKVMVWQVRSDPERKQLSPSAAGLSTSSLGPPRSETRLKTPPDLLVRQEISRSLWRYEKRQGVTDELTYISHLRPPGFSAATFLESVAPSLPLRRLRLRGASTYDSHPTTQSYYIDHLYGGGSRVRVTRSTLGLPLRETLYATL